jgi:hypothetical protein
MILSGWKQIAGYLNSSVRTVQRWEKMGMPVVRPLPSSRGTVIAYSEQVDRWLGRLSAMQTHSAIPISERIVQRGQDFQQNLARSHMLTQQLQQTKLQMSDRMLKLKTEIDLLKKNVTRMNLAGRSYNNERLLLPISSAGVTVVSGTQPPRRSA